MMAFYIPVVHVGATSMSSPYKKYKFYYTKNSSRIMFAVRIIGARLRWGKKEVHHGRSIRSIGPRVHSHADRDRRTERCRRKPPRPSCQRNVAVRPANGRRVAQQYRANSEDRKSVV